jgi:hypothetical protein
VHLRRHEAVVDRFVTPGPLDVVSVQFTSVSEAAAFAPPCWFGSEVSENEDYTNTVIALSGVTPPAQADASNAALEALLDIVEGYGVNSEQDDEQVRRDDALAVTTRAKSLPKAVGLPTTENSASTVKVNDPSPVLGTAPDRQRLGDEWLAKLIHVFSAAHPAQTQAR